MLRLEPAGPREAVARRAVASDFATQLVGMGYDPAERVRATAPALSDNQRQKIPQKKLDGTGCRAA
jgi:hypothetical protein